jgi:hypothetical protein
MAVVKAWEDRRPRSPGFVAAARGAGLGLSVSSRLKQDRTLRNDKWKHCVVGAKVAANADTATAELAAWFKEYQDLTDGSSSTSFDEDDYAATMDGARLAVMAEACKDCSSACEARWGDRRRPWSGARPPLLEEASQQ